MKHARMNDSTQDELEMLEVAWRLAFLLTGCREGASTVLRAAVDEILRHPSADAPARRKRLLLSTVRRRSLRCPARCELSGTLAKLHALKEPGRSALALLCLNALPSEEIQRLLDFDGAMLAHELQTARDLLKPQIGEISAA